jgi:DNA-binding beta-propeller fold protein YncE
LAVTFQSSLKTNAEDRSAAERSRRTSSGHGAIVSIFYNLLFNAIGRWSKIVTFAGVALLLVGGGGAASGQQVNLYVPNSGSAPPILSEYAIDTTTGLLTALSGQATSSTDSNPQHLAMTPDNRFLYVTSSSGLVDAFSVGTSGYLTPLAQYAVDGGPLGIAATASFVYVTSHNSSTIHVFSIGSDGGLTAVTCGACALAGGSAPASAAVDPTGSYLYVALAGAHQIAIGTIGPDGAITSFALQDGGAGTSPFDLTLAPDGSSLYVTDTSFPGSLLAFSASGASMGAPVSYSTGGLYPVGIAIHPSGTYLYVANWASGNISAFTVSGTTLAPIPGSPFAGGNGPYGVTVDPTGQYVYVSNQNGGNVSAFGITLFGSSAGALTPVGAPVATGTAPAFLLAHFVPDM